MKRKIVFHSPIKYLILFILGIVIAFSIILMRGLNLVSAADGFFISGAIFLFLGILSCLNFLGAFDTFSYSFYYVKNSYSKNKENIDMYNYKQNKLTKRSKSNISFTPYLIVGLVYLIVSLVFYIVLKYNF